MPIRGEKVLVTGGQGVSGFPVARQLAGDGNDVHVMARFSDPTARARLEAAGIRCLAHDLTEPFDEVPDDFAYVYHSAIPSRRRPRAWPDSYDVTADAAARL